MESTAYSTLGAQAQTAQGSRESLFDLRERLGKQVEFARSLGFQAHNNADTVFGPIPTSIASAVGKDAPPPCLATLIDELATALNEIQSAFQRLG